MPLPSKLKKIEPGIYKTVDKRWLVDFRPGGNGTPRFRRIQDTLSDARQTKNKAVAKFQNGESLTADKDKRTLLDLALEWFDVHGYTLATGEARLRRLKALAVDLGNPRAIKATPAIFVEYRKQREKNGITSKNLNHELGYLKSMFNELDRAERWPHQKPFEKIKGLKVVKRDVNFLTKSQIIDLLDSASESPNQDLFTVIKICLSTGCRYGEASGLCAENLKGNMLAFLDTKNGLNRYVPVSGELIAEIKKGRPKSGPLFPVSTIKAFTSAVDRAGLVLPRGQLTHVLRHTFASHFMMNGGDILTLRDILGHETIQMTMVYAHLAPDHLEMACFKNPLANL
ncbi:MAG: tyrosine-type recombinase/integrase [Cellvibrionaceae bacterium]